MRLYTGTGVGSTDPPFWLAWGLWKWAPGLGKGMKWTAGPSKPSDGWLSTDCTALWPRKWARYVPPKRSLTFYGTTRKTALFLAPAVRTSNHLGQSNGGPLWSRLPATSVKLPKQSFVMSQVPQWATPATVCFPFHFPSPCPVAPATSCEQVHPAIHKHRLLNRPAVQSRKM
jgi:hypothetical protein